MVSQKERFKPDGLHRRGLEGLSAVMDHLLPETAKPNKVGLSAETVDELIAQLGHETYRLRETAFERLYKLGRGIEPALVRATRHTDAEVSWRARRILRIFSRELSADRSRYVAAFAVYAAGISDADRLRELVRRADATLKRGLPAGGKQQILMGAIGAAARAGKDEYTEPLRPWLDNPDPQLAVLVTRSVGMGATAGKFPPLLLDALKSDRSEIVVQAINYAANCRDESRKPEVKQLLVDILEGDNNSLRLQVCSPLLTTFKHEPAWDFLLSQVASTDRNLRYQALSRLRSLPSPGEDADARLLKAVSPLLKEKQDSSLRRMAVYALASRKGEPVVKALIPMLTDSYSSIPREVERCLGSQTDKEMVRRLLEAAAKNTSDEKLQGKIADQLKKLGPAPQPSATTRSPR